MKKIFLVAKYFAMEDDSDSVEMKHIESALSNLSLVDQKKYAFVYNLLHKDINQQVNSTISDKELSLASNHEKIKFSSEVKKYKKLLEENGLNFDMQITQFIQSKEKNIIDLFKFEDIKSKLQNKIYSQDIAIDVVIDKLVELSYTSDPDSVKGIFFFLGPPATGKTYFAESLEDVLNGYKLKTFGMSNYSSSNQGFALVGLSKGYSNAGEGKLTSFVKKHPKSICLFDEIEKAHPDIQNSLLQIMARGKGVDEFSQDEIDFTDCIFIFTSNLGSELYNNTSFISKMKDDYANAQSMILEAVSREKYATSSGDIPKIKPEFLSRISQGDIVLFNKLSMDSFYKIAHKRFSKYVADFKKQFGIEVTYNKIDIEKILYAQILTFAPVIDARRIKSKLAFKIFDTITDHLRQNRDDHIDWSKELQINIEISKDIKDFIQKNLFDDSKATSKFIHTLFRRNETVSIGKKISMNNGKLTLKFKYIQIKKLPKSKDYSDEDGGITFEIPNISFSDIAGHAKAKHRFKEIISYLKNSQKLINLGVEIPRGMLLYGPPGTGKTMLAKAFANEAQLPFIATTGTDILSIDLMKKIYKRAKEYAPSIVFIDEIDAIGHRDGSNKDIIINQFLTELNGFVDNPNETIFTISATNLPEKIDPAIIRSGRIDLKIKIDFLDKDARGYFIDKILKHSQKDIKRDKLITFTAGMSGADLQKVKRESILEMIRENKQELTEEIILEQINIIKYGTRITNKSIEQLVTSTAYHEASHAVISHVLMPEVKIEQITVVPRNDALGFVSYNVDDMTQNLTFEDIKHKVCVAFAGRVAQIKQFGKQEGIDSGASSDLDMATRLLYYALAIVGMGESIGYINISSIKDQLSEGGLNLQIEERIQELTKELKKVTTDLVEKHWEKICKVAQVLIKNEFVDEKEFLQILY